MKILTSKLIILITLLTAQASFADLVLYTDRPTAKLAPIAEEFLKLTGQKVQIVELAYPDLKARLETEKDQTPADLIFVKDFIFLNELTAMGWFKPMSSVQVQNSIVDQMKNSSHLWTAITYRVRTVIYNSSIVNPNDIKEYTDLAKSQWAGKICLRSGTHPYNQALVANFVARLGSDVTTAFLTDVIANLAQAPMANDKAVIEAVASGQCEVGIVNHYYLAPYVEANPAYVVKPLFMNQSTTGVHTNGTGMGITKTSKNEQLANQFINLMLEDSVQLSFSQSHFEYPAKKSLSPSSIINTWGGFKAEELSWEKIGQFITEAKAIISNVQYK